MRTRGKQYPIDAPESKANSWLFLLIGLAILLFGWQGVQQYNQIEEELVEVEASIVRVAGSRKHRDVFVTYTYQGNTYEEVELNMVTTSMKVGDQVLVPIHPDEPWQPVYNTLEFWFVFGLIFTSFSLIFLIGAYWPRKPKEKHAPKPNQPKKRKKKKKKRHRRR